MVKIMENPIKMDDLGGTTIFGNIQLCPEVGGIFSPHYPTGSLDNHERPSDRSRCHHQGSGKALVLGEGVLFGLFWDVVSVG